METFLDNHKSIGGSSNTGNDNEVINIIHQITQQLEYLHNRNIVHLDIKLSNILSIGDNYYLIDYGESYNFGIFDKLRGTEYIKSPEMTAFTSAYFGFRTVLWHTGQSTPSGYLWVSL